MTFEGMKPRLPGGSNVQFQRAGPNRVSKIRKPHSCLDSNMPLFTEGEGGSCSILNQISSHLRTCSRASPSQFASPYPEV